MKKFNVVVYKGLRVEYTISAKSYDHASSLVNSREPACAIIHIEPV